MSKKYTHKQGFKPKDEIQIAIIKKNIPGLHGDILPKVQIIMDEWLKYSKLKQYLVDKYSNVPPFNGEFTTEVGVSKRSELSKKVFTILKKLSIAENPEGEDRYGLDTASTDIEKIFISETQQLQNRVKELEGGLSGSIKVGEGTAITVGNYATICPHDGHNCYDSMCGRTTNICNNSHSFSKETILNDGDKDLIKQAHNEAIEACIKKLQEYQIEGVHYLSEQLTKLKK